MNEPSQLIQLLSRLVVATERIADALETNGSTSGGNGPNLYRDLGEYPNFDWASIKARAVSYDADGATEVEHAGAVYSRRCKNGDIWFSSKTGTEDGEPTYSRLVTFKVGHEIEELPKGVRKAIAVSVANQPQPVAVVPAPALPEQKMGTIVPTSPEPVTTHNAIVIPNQNRGKVSEGQLKRLFAMGRQHGWSSGGIRVLTHSYQESTKDLTQDQYEQVCSQLQSIDPNPFNSKADGLDPKRYVRRFRALTKGLGLKGRAGDQLIQQSLSDHYPTKKSSELIPAEADVVRDAILILYGSQQVPSEYRAEVTDEYLSMVAAMGDEINDDEIAQAWLEVLGGLIRNAAQRDSLSRTNDVNLAEAL